MDLSVNNFGLNDCKLIRDVLKTNRTLYGFHFQGNHGHIDGRGFL